MKPVYYINNLIFNRILIAILILTVLPASASPLSEIEKDNWVYDALSFLEDRRLIEGYPDGFFKGDRPLTRYEAAMTVARILSKLQLLEASTPKKPDLSLYITEDERELLNKLVKEFNSELTSHGITITNIENTIENLNSRIEKLEKIKINGALNVTAVSIGYSPDEMNTKSFGNPYPPSSTPGPVIMQDRDRYNGANGGSLLFSGSAIMSRLDLNISSNITERLKAGLDFISYSSFGEKGIIDECGIMPPCNTMGQISSRLHFDSHAGTLWFDSDGDLDLTGRIGEFELKNISKNLFFGIRNSFSYGGRDVLPMNGINIYGNLYRTLNIEIFMANNLNTFKPGDTTGIPSQFRYTMATPYNDGAGCYRVNKYGIIDPGQYDNSACGLWLGHDFSKGRAHIEGAIIRLYEDYASNPSLGIDKNLTSPPKDSIYYGIKASYNWPGEKIKLYGEFNRTIFDYNLLDNSDGHGGNFLNTGVSFKFVPFSFFSEYFRIDPNYDPLGYHQHWGRLYQGGTGHHDGWRWTYGSFSSNGRRFSNTRPNRTGINLGINWKLGNDMSSALYTNFTYLEQVKPTLITACDDSFQKYDFLTGNTVPDLTGINIYGNLDHMFTVSDPAKGKEYAFEAGGKYKIKRTLHTWGYFEYHNFTRDYELINYKMDVNYYFANTGITWYPTGQLSLQGYVNYVNVSGLNETGNEVKWDQIIPGFGLRYSFSENMEFILDYKFYSYSSDTPCDVYDKVPDINNDYNANKLMTRLTVKF
ncbi:MAG: S-layer homology domain-containing protein [Candidatus Eremiobacterota bacterium]